MANTPVTGRQAPQPKGNPPVRKSDTWVQTERKAHEAWSDLCIKKPRAAAMLHRLVSLMQPHGNVVVISMGDLAKVMGCGERTAYRAAEDLQKGNWVQRVKVSGSVYGFAVNSEVAWAGFRGSKYEGAAFTAAVIAPRDEMEKSMQAVTKLRQVPILYPPDEKPLAIETGGEPGAQTLMPGTERGLEIQPEERLGDPELDQLDFSGRTRREME